MVDADAAHNSLPTSRIARSRVQTPAPQARAIGPHTTCPSSRHHARRRSPARWWLRDPPLTPSENFLPPHMLKFFGDLSISRPRRVHDPRPGTGMGEISSPQAVTGRKTGTFCFLGGKNVLPIPVGDCPLPS
ncbi:hypothetical protein PVAP13_9KG624050 [Panicum virgatum]|uniref:Uncharacterized protein n=1 Tax=Panicum virgatum TaxID=38727 RepID=A0A8T0P0S9_PANVG|nr:hypothetical protein PVAP13_9KG624050 [Panicum virgatum]